MKLQPENQKEASAFENLFCELVNSEYDVNLQEKSTEMGIFFKDWYLIIGANGKWRIE